MNCAASQRFCLIRGDTWQKDIGLCDGFDEVVAAPLSYTGRLVMRLDQDDTLPDLVDLVVAVEVTGDAAPAPVAYLRFELPPAMTQALPAYDLVYFIELQKTGSAYVRRLMEGRIDVRD